MKSLIKHWAKHKAAEAVCPELLPTPAEIFFYFVLPAFLVGIGVGLLIMIRVSKRKRRNGCST